MGGIHLTRLVERADIEVSGLYDYSPVAAAALGEMLDVRVAASLEELLFESDALIIACSTSAHFDVTMKAIEAGVHVLLEKPATGSVDLAMRLFKRAEEKNVVMKVGFLERARLSAIPDGLLPREITTVRAHRFSVNPPRDPSADIVADLMIHDLDIAAQLIDREPISVEAHEAADGVTSCQIDFGDGVQAVFSSSYRANELSRVFAIEGESKQLFIDFQKSVYREIATGASGELPTDAITLECSTFLDAIRSGKIKEQHRQVRSLHWGEAIRLALGRTSALPVGSPHISASAPESKPL